MTFEEEEKCRKRGYNDYWKLDTTFDSNPYPKGSEEHEWWYIGWLDAINDAYEGESYNWL